jgi:DNA-binding NtrC family response regulator
MDRLILVCDDDPEIRAALRRTLHRFQVTAVASMPAALAELKQRHYDAVVSDFDLGEDVEHDGLELLQMTRVLYPDTARVMITGNSDIRVAIRALNEGAVHRFFLKPWDDDQLVATIEIALRTAWQPRAAVNP